MTFLFKKYISIFAKGNYRSAKSLSYHQNYEVLKGLLLCLIYLRIEYKFIQLPKKENIRIGLISLLLKTKL